MPKYLVVAGYTAPDGVKGLIVDGGTVRVRAIEELLSSVGGRLESFYYGLGRVTAYLIIEVPDEASAVAVTLTVNASGLGDWILTPLMAPAEIDEAVKLSPLYDAPGPTG